MKKTYLVFGAIVLAAGLFLAWLFRESTRPMPGLQVEVIGWEHASDISRATYNTNPPTSGLHFPVWAKRGVYDRVISDGHLIHSLEHGYVVISYNCLVKQSGLLRPALAKNHGDLLPANESTSSAAPLTKMRVSLSGQMSFFTPENPPPQEVELPAEFLTDSCKELKNQLSDFLKRHHRLIIVPRLDLDTRIALTAWGRIDKFNQFDHQRVESFIKAYHNQGREQTKE